MSTNLSSSAKKVQEALSAKGLPCVVVELPASTRTAAEAAQAIGCQVGQIVKSLIFRGKETGRPYLILASGPNRVDERKIAAVTGECIEKADAEFVRTKTGFAIGGIPPIAHAEVILTLIDQDLLAFSEVWAAAGTPNAVFEISSADLPGMTGGEVVAVK